MPLNKDGRGKIISSICQVNCVIFDVTQAVGKVEPFWMWPSVDTEEGNIDRLRDERVVEVLRKQGKEHCFVETWSFGQAGLAMNSKGQFVITESKNRTVKVFDRRLRFMDHFSLPVGNVDQVRFQVFDVAVDMIDNFFVLVKLQKLYLSIFETVVYMFDKNGGVHHQFPVKADQYERAVMVVNSKRKVVITFIRYRGGNALDVYENDGQFVRSFGEGLLSHVLDVALASDDRVIVLDSGDFFVHSYVHMFSEDGDHLSKFKLFTSKFSPTLRRGITFHHSSERIIASYYVIRGDGYLEFFTKDGEFVRSTLIRVRDIIKFQRGMIMTAEGHVALLSVNLGRVSVFC